MHIRLENTESQKAQKIGELVRSYNRSKREAAESESLNLYIEDEHGRLLAGLVAETFGNWLEIEYLFVKEELRGQGIGSQLLQQAESEAKNRNCRFAFVNTYQFQAPDFYKRHGYKEVFRLQDYPYIGQRYYYQKDL
ncbi:GNAT family N-acetyltransferase [Streptococcus sp. DTU_2020_1001019_1_SI_AUS_MUR_006]|uniref:GNAT family N-acetyltransferase n=1 Tax=Streptococcus sp. DTU_2020_1001019_1_SI_AUS_MUR_006 TaxID=3077584 RepID=UPI0028E83A30|nr:GNAT family N-acetyltransferase [Streptococcus sp. DTU_2020_1001019_1_SI_AUS_MUR_006]WNS72358.1 GNAT family N-acetyltransferase [Streptococcus sp. DTU_2020_1001019_1_SI_AUS_MUR_006]